MKSIRTYLQILIILPSIIFLISCSSEPPKIDSGIISPVKVQDVRSGEITRYVQTTGTITPVKDVMLKSAMTGKYRLLINPSTNKPYALGDRVRKDQVIIKLEDAEFENNIRLESKKLALTSSENTFKKQQSLYDKGGVTQSELKVAERDFINTKYDYQDALLQLEKVNVRAPFDGIIVEMPYYTQGVKLDQNSEMARVMNYDQLLMEADFPEKHLREVKKGSLAEITHYTLVDDTLQAVVQQVSPTISESTRAFHSMLEIENKEGKLRPGMFVRANLIVQKRDSTIVIPKEIIATRGNDKVVFVVENGRAKRRNIRTGLENEIEIEVLSGIKLGDRLVIEGFETLRDDAQVEVSR
ncbi:MAG: efflux RND transporter periplasmic adaptor subunit [Bacteroidota bacterium]